MAFKEERNADGLKVIDTKNKRGLVLVITGDGKGKTTSALGITLRAYGYGMKVCIIHFIKGDIHSGEMDALKHLKPNVEEHFAGVGFYKIRGDDKDPTEHIESANKGMDLAFEKLESGEFDIVILDEINVAVNMDLIDVERVVEFISKKPKETHIVLTGRNAHDKVIELAHTVTELKEVKHAMQKGIEPQQGIDY